jgi:hypothetical protein|tara:strand:+ start:644 stop:1276 length:633 start_codon:yes stop_codon:yes gene_type:complete
MLITTKENLRGELYLSAIGHTLRAGSSTTVDNKYSSDPDILWAVSKGLIEVSVSSDDSEEGTTDNITITNKDYITLKNTGNSLLNLPFMTKSVDPKCTFTLSHDDFGRSEISMLIENGFVEVVIETPKKVTKKKKVAKKVTKKKDTVKESPPEEVVESIVEPAEETKKDINKEKASINENKQTGDNPVTISFPEVDEDGIIFVDNNNEVN